jgi:hypothetical protein
VNRTGWNQKMIMLAGGPRVHISFGIECHTAGLRLPKIADHLTRIGILF